MARTRMGATVAPRTTLDLDAELAVLRSMSPSDLQRRYAEAFGEPTRCRQKPWLIKRIAWRLQAIREGDLSERARRRAAELARDADLRVRPPKTPAPRTVAAPHTIDSRLPAAGNMIRTTYKGAPVEVTVLAEGFEWDGQRFKTLSAVAKAITGSHTNGYLFFRLGKYAGGAQ